jgi:hypothetical protein
MRRSSTRNGAGYPAINAPLFHPQWLKPISTAAFAAGINACSTLFER